ncbi:large ribosomal subunit protein mL54 [Cottoperca gobio]|uniref:Large ribosomal subunit protein mL54 n=1 Tax=Cottoperca gobio TaxID=56716 RepID=A0A6J2PHS8_COTGO|nr:39S ribosomal protein L54, mitochondrial [Cottoperca gobio]
MSGYSLFRIITLTKCITNNATTSLCRTHALSTTQTCGYAKKVVAKAKGKGAAKDGEQGPAVCKDTIRLTSYAVGTNIFKIGEDPQLKPHDQYPEWLFQLNLDLPKKLNELEPDSWEYRKRMRKENIWRFNKLQKGKKF